MESLRMCFRSSGFPHEGCLPWSGGWGSADFARKHAENAEVFVLLMNLGKLIRIAYRSKLTSAWHLALTRLYRCAFHTLRRCMCTLCIPYVAWYVLIWRCVTVWLPVRCIGDGVSYIRDTYRSSVEGWNRSILNLLFCVWPLASKRLLRRPFVMACHMTYPYIHHV